MKLLILGGTRFVGRHLAAAALARGHDVTLFHRGRSNPLLFPEAEHRFGDRADVGGGLSDLRGPSWDAVIDLSGYVPREVRASARLLAGAVERYVFISTISVYEDLDPGTVATEESPVEEPEPGDEELEAIPPRGYGRLKAGCERVIEEEVPGRALIVRPGLIAGPYDSSQRFSWWVARVAQGGEVLAPGRPEDPVQVIDARDLAAWVLAMTERREAGTFNALGPEGVLTMGELLETCREAAGSNAAFTWVSGEFLEEHEVRVPLWPGLGWVDNARARARGLTFRPLAETVLDILAEREPVRLNPEGEAELLRAWHARSR